MCSSELKCVCYLGWAGEDCNATSPLSYLVVGPTSSVSGNRCYYNSLLPLSIPLFISHFWAFSPSSPSVLLCFPYLSTLSSPLHSFQLFCWTPSPSLIPFTHFILKLFFLFCFSASGLMSAHSNQLHLYSLNHACHSFRLSLFSHSFFVDRLMSLTEWLEVRFEFLFIVFVSSLMSFPGPFSLSPQLQLHFSRLILTIVQLQIQQSVMFSWMGLYCTYKFPSEWCWGRTAVWFFSVWSPLFSLYTFPAKCYCVFVFCCSVSWFVYPLVSTWFGKQETHIQLTHIWLHALFSPSVSGISSTNIIIGAIAGSILVLALVLAVTAWCYKWVSLNQTGFPVDYTIIDKG